MDRTRARALRRNATDAERRLWARLRSRRLTGLKFRRQVPVMPYIVDFLCADRRLIVELDGSQHAAQAEDDCRRTAYLESQGYFVIRFWNEEVLQNLDGVLSEILRISDRAV